MVSDGVFGIEDGQCFGVKALGAGQIIGMTTDVIGFVVFLWLASVFLV